MKKHASYTRTLLVAAVVAVVLILLPGGARATITGISGPSFNLNVRTGQISTPDGASFLIWGYADGAGPAQFPGPTLIVNQGELVTVTLTNNLTVAGGETPPNVSLVFPGQEVTASGGVAGELTNEAAPGGNVTYSFTASHAGTYMYYSGTESALQVEMGLVGALIVRPAMGAGYAYNHADSQFDHEILFLLSEMDPRIHEIVELDGPSAVAGTDYLSNYFPVVWFINGRGAPDTMSPANAFWLPHQPYNCIPRIHPGEKLLMRVIDAGRDLHPFHHHGNHSRIIAQNGRLLESAPGAGADLSQEVFTVQTVPGQTVDALFEWTGKGLGWDVYGTPEVGLAHDCTDTNADNFDDDTYEYCPDHYKPIPVVLPGNLDVALGGFYSGSPYLGSFTALPPGEGGMNPYGGFAFMWHSHTEKEMVNYDIFPGGMMTMFLVLPYGAPIP